jgi:hypothetical protein
MALKIHVMLKEFSFLDVVWKVVAIISEEPTASVRDILFRASGASVLTFQQHL